MNRPTLTSALFITCFALNATAISPPNMKEETDTSGIEQQYTGGWEYFVGGGVASFDCNGDRYPELYFAGGSSSANLFINRSQHSGKLTFEKKQDSILALESVTGAYPIDINSDGVLDLVVLRLGENYLFKGLGNCEFKQANKEWNFDGGSAWSTAFAATWEKDKDHPTLAIGNYVDRSQPGAPFGTCHNTDLYRPTNTDFYLNSEQLTPGYCALSMVFTDWSRNGTADLRIANDRQYYRGGHEQLWDMSQVVPKEYTEEDGWRRLKLWGMGIAATDLTGDGRNEYFVTSMADNKLRTLASRNEPTFEDIAFAKGVTAHRPFIGDSVLPSTAWHAQFDDVNNDSFIDLFVVKGNVEAMTDFALEDPNNLFLGTPGGQFFEAADKANMISFHRGRGGSLVDLNLDGLLDAVIVNREENIQVWRNLGQGNQKPAAMGNWVALQLHQNLINQHAVGSWIEVRIADRTQTREVIVGGGHVSGNATWHHFGIGVAERAIARVQWPDGEWSPWIRLFANQHARITKGKSVADIWLPAASAKQ